MSDRVLVLGATGTLGEPVVRSLTERGHAVRVLARNVTKARQMFPDPVEVVVGDSSDKSSMENALDGCDAVHVSLPHELELTAAQHIIDLAPTVKLERISYVSATGVCEEHRWFEIIDAKARTEELLSQSGIPHTVFRPTWVMEVLPNFVKRTRAVMIEGRNPPGFHFFAAADFGRMVANAYADERAIGKRLYIHGPEAITLPDALLRFFTICYPQHKVMRLKLWQARLIAQFKREMGLVTRLIGFYDKVVELGDPAEANALLGAPTTTLDQWTKSWAETQQTSAVRQ